jgi:AraC family transcriptional regulator
VPSPQPPIKRARSRPRAAGLTLGTPLERVDAGDFTVTRTTYAPAQHLPRHAHEDACATIVLRGTLTERVAGRRFELGRESFLVRPAGEPHENRYGHHGAECVLVGLAPRWVSEDAVARSVFACPAATAAPAVTGVARRMRRELRVGDAAAILAIEGLALELIASAARQLEIGVRRSAPRWLRLVRDLLHDEPTPVTRLDVLAQSAGVHPVHLTRAFRQFYGCTPGEYLRQRRIDRACVELAETDRSIAEIAYQAGFASPSHFATTFRRMTGTSPRAYRAAVRDWIDEPMFVRHKSRSPCG